MRVKVFLLVALVAFFNTSNAQEEKESRFINGESEYDSWSISAYIGPNSIYTGDLLTDESGFKFGIETQLGVTKWFNHAFGVEGLLQIGKTKQTVATSNMKGKTTFVGLSMNGVLNLNTVFRRGDLTGKRKWNAYVYAGVGVMDFKSEATNTITNVTASFSNDGFPLRSLYSQGGAILSRRLNDNFDISARANFLLSGRDKFDGVLSTKHANAQERLLTGTIGVTYHFGTKEKLVWSDPFDFKVKQALKDMKPETPKVTIDLNDDDADGVVNQFDKEPNTVAMAIVDGAGRAIDTDLDGVPDGIDKCPLVKGEANNNGCPKVEEVKQVNLDNINLSLKGITFDTAKSIIKPQFYGILNNAVQTLNSYPNKRFMVIGYTDCVGNYASNQKLSERRANAVKTYLINKGVSSSVISAIGEGENNPINECSSCNSCSREEHKENRRIEIKVVN